MPRIPEKRAAAPEWLPALICVKHDRHGEFAEVEGKVCGPLILWHTSEGPDGPPWWWSVGTANTGLALVRLVDEPTARRVGELLLAKVPQETLETVGADKLKHALPGWVKSWCLKLLKDRAWVEPEGGR